MPINLPEKAKGVQDNMGAGGGTIELPWPAAPFWVINGNAQLKQLGGPQYFGGWAASKERLLETRDAWKDLPYPIPGFEEAELAVDSSDKMLAVLATRSLRVVPIGTRQFSTVFENGTTRRVPPFTPGARPGIQVLSILGYKTAEGVQPWAPVMLTAKGYQVNHVSKAFSGWKKALMPVLKTLAPEASPWFFWMSIGTFGTERVQEMVGGAQKQPITPIRAYIPEDLTADQVEKLYIGTELVEFYADIQEQAGEWLHAFDGLNQQAQALQAQAAASHYPPPPEEPPYDTTAEEIPF